MNERSQSIQKLVKSAARSRGLSNIDLARTLKVSEPTIKRWLRGEGLSMPQWLKLLDAVGLRLSEVAAMIEDTNSEQFEYSVKQEKALAETTGLLAYFQALLLGKTPRQIAKKFDLSMKSSTYYLRTLDNLGLIVWTEGMTCKLRVHGEPRWRSEGALSKKFRKEMMSEFIWARRESRDFKIGIYEVTKNDAEEVDNMITELYSHLRSLEKKAQLMKLKTSSVAIGTCFSKYQPNFLYHVPNR